MSEIRIGMEVSLSRSDITELVNRMEERLTTTLEALDGPVNAVELRRAFPRQYRVRRRLVAQYRHTIF